MGGMYLAKMLIKWYKKIVYLIHYKYDIAGNLKQLLIKFQSSDIICSQIIVWGYPLLTGGISNQGKTGRLICVLSMWYFCFFRPIHHCAT
jgi:hypothetical protein